MMMFLQVSGLITLGVSPCLAAPAATYRSPLSVAVSLDGMTLYVSDKTAGCVTALDAAKGGDLLLKSVEDYHASFMSIHWWPREMVAENRETVLRINQRILRRRVFTT